MKIFKKAFVPKFNQKLLTQQKNQNQIYYKMVL